MHKGKGERLWSFSLFSCSITAWLWFVSLLSALARTQPRHSSGDSSLQALFHKIYGTILAPFPSTVIPQYTSTFALHSLLQYIPGYAIHTLHPSISEHPDGLQNAVFWTLSAESSRSYSSRVLEAPRYDWGYLLWRELTFTGMATSQSTLSCSEKRQTASKLNSAKAWLEKYHPSVLLSGVYWPPTWPTFAMWPFNQHCFRRWPGVVWGITGGQRLAGVQGVEKTMLWKGSSCAAVSKPGHPIRFHGQKTYPSHPAVASISL